MIDDSLPGDDPRKARLEAWLDAIEVVSGQPLRPASGDASFRRYFRLQSAKESSGEPTYIAMDAPPPQEDCLPFVRIAGYLEAMQLNAPRIVEADMEQGFLLLTDLGSEQYLGELEGEPTLADRLYQDAIDALVQMQQAGSAYQASLPPYDAELLEFELSLFHDWLCETHLGIRFSSADEMAWRDTCSSLIRNALDQPRVFVHRDYHSRNLMRCAPDNPGILDFQDAVEGPFTYDLVSLLKDCYIRLSGEQRDAYSTRFYAGLDTDLRARVGEDLFRRYYDLMGVQRHLKAAGIFARLNHRDGKPGYLDDVPRTLSYVTELKGGYDELGWLIELIETKVLPSMERGA